MNTPTPSPDEMVIQVKNKILGRLKVLPSFFIEQFLVYSVNLFINQAIYFLINPKIQAKNLALKENGLYIYYLAYTAFWNIRFVK